MEHFLIISSDDFGLCSSVNHASIEAYCKGCVTSLSVMPSAPAFKEAVALAKRYGLKHVGVHLTLTSEFPAWRWAPVMLAKDVPSLVDHTGTFYATLEDFSRRAKTEDVLNELEHQIMAVIKSGLRPTHLDCHMFALHHKVSGRNDFAPIISYLCKTYRLPFRSPFPEETRFLSKENIPLLTDCPVCTYDVPALEKKRIYDRIIQDQSCHISELILHCGYDDEELKRITAESRRRQADYDYAMDPKTREYLERCQVTLVSWKEAFKSESLAVERH